MLATDFSMSAMFWMFFKIPFSCFRGGSGSVGWGGGGGRRDTGRKAGTSENEGSTKVDGRMSEGDRGGGRGGGGGGGGSGGGGGGGGVCCSI